MINILYGLKFIVSCNLDFPNIKMNVQKNCATIGKSFVKLQLFCKQRFWLIFMVLGKNVQCLVEYFLLKNYIYTDTR